MTGGRGKRLSYIDAHVGRQIWLRRKSIGMTAAALGARLGITFQQIQKYEKGSNRVGAGRLYDIAVVLGVPISYFFDGLRERAEDDAPLEAFPGSGRAASDALKFSEAFYRVRNERTRKQILQLLKTLSD